MDVGGNQMAGAGPRVRLTSWKSIAAFLDRDVRTAQRWRRERGLPVQRIPGGHGSVFAYEDELLAWLHGGQQSASNGAEASPDQASDAREEALEPTRETDGPGSVAAAPASPGSAAEAVPKRPRRSLFRLLSSVALVALVLLAAATGWSMHLRRHREPGTPDQASAPAPGFGPAHDLINKGDLYFEKRTAVSLKMALDAFQQAQQAEPASAPAYAGMAATYELLPEYAGVPPEQAFPRALEAARMAVKLDPRSARAHTALAFALFYWSWQTAAAEKEFKRSLELNPRDVQTHHWYANCLLSLRKLDAAEQQIDLARELDPASESIAADQALIKGVHGEDLDAHLKTLLELERADPAFRSPAQYRLALLEYSGRYDQWIAELKKVAAATHNRLDAQLAQAAQQGWRRHNEHELWTEVRRVQQAASAMHQLSPIALANTCVRLGDKPGAIRALDDALATNNFELIVFVSDPIAGSLDSEPGYRSIKTAVGERMQMGS